MNFFNLYLLAVRPPRGARASCNVPTGGRRRSSTRRRSARPAIWAAATGAAAVGAEEDTTTGITTEAEDTGADTVDLVSVDIGSLSM